MKALNFIVGLAVLIIITIVIFSKWGFEITMIFLVIDLSVGVSYQFTKINNYLEED